MRDVNARRRRPASTQVMMLQRITTALVEAIARSATVANRFGLINHFQCALEATEKRWNFTRQVDQQVTISARVSCRQLYRVAVG